MAGPVFKSDSFTFSEVFDTSTCKFVSDLLKMANFQAELPEIQEIGEKISVIFSPISWISGKNGPSHVLWRRRGCRIRYVIHTSCTYSGGEDLVPIGCDGLNITVNLFSETKKICLYSKRCFMEFNKRRLLVKNRF